MNEIHRLAARMPNQNKMNNVPPIFAPTGVDGAPSHFPTLRYAVKRTEVEGLYYRKQSQRVSHFCSNGRLHRASADAKATLELQGKMELSKHTFFQSVGLVEAVGIEPKAVLTGRKLLIRVNAKSAKYTGIAQLSYTRDTGTGPMRHEAIGFPRERP
jgi:hypothetical protein